MAAKTKSNGMELCFVVLMCLGTLANGQACVPCGCETQQQWVNAEDPTALGFVPLPGIGLLSGSWVTFERCKEALNYGEPIEEYGKCGVDRGTNFCAGCVKTMNGGIEVVEAKYDQGCPPTTTTTVTTTTVTTITTTTTTVTTTTTITTTTTTITTTTTTITTTTTTVTTVTTEHYECHCLYDGDTLPEESWTAAGNPLYGTYCANWDSLPGTNGHINDSTCPPSKKYHPDCNFMNLPWCYVKDGCTGAWHVQSGVVAGAAYSYDMCGAPDCSVGAWDDALCPAGVGGEHDHEKTCHCLFEGTTLPEESAAYYGNPLYGTNCEEEWDEMPGTKNYAAGKTENCFGAEGEECTKECNWRHARWCFVEKGCNGLEKDEVVVDANKQDNLKKGVQLTKPSFLGEVGYSYAMCHYADCYGDNFDDNPECPFGEKCLTCGMVKYDFKTGGCCGHPEKHIIIHHLYHDLGEFPHHHHFPHDDDTHGHR